MTVIGKILTFLVFFMSVVFLGFAITINMMNKDTKTGQNWKAVAENLRNKAVPDLQNDLAQKDLDITKLRAEINKLTTDLKVTTDESKKIVDQAKDLLAAADAAAKQAKDSFFNSQLAVKAAQDELEKRRQEALALHSTIKQKDIVIANMQGEKTILTNEKIQHQVASVTFMNRAQALEKQVTDLTKALEEERIAKAEKVASGPGRGVGVSRPPPDDVKGIVKSVTADGFVSISIGSDAGLLRGHTLEVFRLDPKPQYFGTIQIVEVGPHEAVGKLQVAKFAKQVQPNDQVASKILPSLPSR